MITARDIMHAGVCCIRTTDSVREAAELMAEHHVGALPVCGADGQIRGMITDRDIVTKVIARGDDPRLIRAGEVPEGRAVAVGVDDGIETLIAVMIRHQVRRIPVVDGDRLVGIVAQADVARNLPDESVGELVSGISVQSSDGSESRLNAYRVAL